MTKHQKVFYALIASMALWVPHAHSVSAGSMASVVPASSFPLGDAVVAKSCPPGYRPCAPGCCPT